jgi:hypothetical protein
MLHPVLVSGMTNEQVAIKIAHEILKYSAGEAQLKLSLLQDLVITLLPGARESVDLTKKLQGCRSRCNSEDVVNWMDALLTVYMRSDQASSLMRSLTAEQIEHPY